MASNSHCDSLPVLTGRALSLPSRIDLEVRLRLRR